MLYLDTELLVYSLLTYWSNHTGAIYMLITERGVGKKGSGGRGGGGWGWGFPKSSSPLAFFIAGHTCASHHGCYLVNLVLIGLDLFLSSA